MLQTHHHKCYDRNQKASEYSTAITITSIITCGRTYRKHLTFNQNLNLNKIQVK